jgi:hypothetical protein
LTRWLRELFAFWIILFEPSVGGILVGKHLQMVDVAAFLAWC